MTIDVYYDISCCRCELSRSTDYEKGMATSKEYLRKIAVKEGWKTDKKSKRPVCPLCCVN